jgi:hypothetical protein
MEKVFFSGETIHATIRATMSLAIFFSKNLDNNSNYEAGVINFSNGKTIEGQPAQGLYKFSQKEELTHIQNVSSTKRLLTKRLCNKTSPRQNVSLTKRLL